MKRVAVFAVCMAAILVLPVGCNSQSSSERDQPVEMSGPPPTIGEDHEHDEEHQGPYGGHVIDLGHTHELHAEIVDDDQSRTVTVYVLGGDLQELAIEQPAIHLSLVVDGKPQSFVLPAEEPVGGKASRFQSTDSEAFTALHEHRATGRLLVRIDGKSYSGAIEHHDHDDHQGHDHDH